MPVYAYKCRDCGTPLEVHQEFSDAALTECPVCGGALRKQYGTIGVTFNGSGFYRTDSRAASAEGGSSGSGEGGSAKSDAKSSGDSASSSSSSSSSSEKKSDGGAAAKPAAATTTKAAPAS